jgi:hypothetical protein
MRPSSASSSKAYPNGDGVSLSSTEGVLTFKGICTRAAGLDNAEVREHVDAALRAGVLRRGLVLRCATCEQKQFQTVDNLGQRWKCARCDTLNDLDHRAWKLPPDEPTWFYDLHPVGRHVLEKNGDVPVLLSAHLRAQRRNPHEAFDDVEEVLFLQEGQQKAEVDLVSYTDDVLTVAECKSSGRTANDVVTKKCRAAAWLRADRLLFAKTGEEWTPATRDRVNRIVREFPEWGPLGMPQVEFVANLDPSDTEVSSS